MSAPDALSLAQKLGTPAVTLLRALLGASTVPMLHNCNTGGAGRDRTMNVIKQLHGRRVHELKTCADGRARAPVLKIQVMAANACRKIDRFR